MHSLKPERYGFLGNLASVLAILRWLPGYDRAWLRPDLVAGITLAAYAVPVSLAYATLAGLPPQAGLYCYLAGGIAYALFGTSNQVAVGPTSAISILIGSAIGAMAAGDAAHQWQLAMFAAILAGVIGVIAWLLKLGGIVSFVSETILSGFKVGAGLVIATTQFPKLFGISSEGSNFFTRIIELVRHLGDVNMPSLAVGLGCLALLILGERFLPGRPVALGVVVLSIAVMSLAPLEALGVKTVGAIPSGLPLPGWPDVRLKDPDGLLGLALACFLLSYIESISVARTFGLKHRYPVDPNQELLAVGISNFAAGVSSGYPLAGGMSQSAVNEKAGARTPLALVFASGAIGVVLLFLTGMMSNLPQPVLAAVVLMAVKDLIRLKELRHYQRVSRLEFNVAMAAVIGVLLFGILMGILLAAIFSLLLLLKQASRPRITVLGRFPGTDRFGEISRYPEVEQVPGVLALRVESAFLYFNTQNILEEIVRLAGERQPPVSRVVIDLSTSPNFDLAGVRMLDELRERLSDSKISLCLAEMHGTVRDLLEAEGHFHLLEDVGRRVGIAECIDT
ncbi:SulP family inorganic anion transporter [bacterium]|nr:SulP family inorganic anion transporter [bacterium]